jgi:hypothetical protein
MGDGVDHQEPDWGCVKSIFREWATLRPQHRPVEPSALMRLLRDIYQYPHPDYLTASGDLVSRAKDIDRAWDTFSKAARRLSDALPRSDHYHVLQIFMEERMPSEADGHKLALRQTEELVHRLAIMPSFRRRPARSAKRGKPLVNPELRIIVQAICWYVARVEKKPIRSSLDDLGRPRSRVARIVEATCAGMGLKVASTLIESQIESARKLPLNKLKWWDLREVLPTSQ